MGPNPLEHEQLEFSAFSPDDWWTFLRVSQPTGEVNSTPTHTSRTELHSMITFHHTNTRGSRVAMLRIARLCVHKIIVIHVSCLAPCRTWHWAQAQVLSPFSSTSPIYPTVSPTHTRSVVHDPYLPCDVPRQSSGSTQIPSLASHEPKSAETQVIEIESIEPDSSPEELNLTGVWGQIRIKHKNSFEKLHCWRRGRIWKSWCRDVLPPVTDALRLRLSGEHCRLGCWRWRITKNAGITTEKTKSRGL